MMLAVFNALCMVKNNLRLFSFWQNICLKKKCKRRSHFNDLDCFIASSFLYSISKRMKWKRFNPIKARWAQSAPSPKSQHIFKTASSLELLLCDFFYVFSIMKSSVPPISPHVCCHGNHATFWLIF